MHKETSFANINVMIAFYIVTGLFQILFFPLLFSINVYGSLSDKKVYFSINYASIIKVVSGYFTFDKNKVYVHISKKLAVKLNSVNMIEDSKKFNKLKSFEVLSIQSSLRICDVNTYNAIMIYSGYNIFYSIFSSIKKTYKPFINTQCVVDRSKSNDYGVLLRINFAFNAFVLLTILFKKILENTIYARK